MLNFCRNAYRAPLGQQIDKRSVVAVRQRLPHNGPRVDEAVRWVMGRQARKPVEMGMGRLR